jgi:hypothetical protein
VQATDKVRQHKLPEKIAENHTHLVWRGEASLALERLISMLRDEVAAVPAKALISCDETVAH